MSETGPAVQLHEGFRDPADRMGLVFGVTPAKVLAFGKNPYTQTRYRFAAR